VRALVLRDAFEHRSALLEAGLKNEQDLRPHGPERAPRRARGKRQR
jgi:hypothetical protein